MKPMARRRTDTPTCLEAIITILVIVGCILVFGMWTLILGG